jgi:ectoine hydroxylase-related dioxygenase (phytanoyl-CoA dioxygenase family)
MRCVCPGGYQGGPPVEVAMSKGDVMIWHCWCVHASSVNRGNRVRQAVISRFHSTVHGDSLRRDAGGVRTDGDLWKYWGRAVRECTGGVRTEGAAARL